MPLVTLGGGVQVDVGTFQTSERPESANGGITTQIWAPPQPLLSAVVDFVSLDVYEIRVMQQMGGPKLGAGHRAGQPGQQGPAESPSRLRHQMCGVLAAGCCRDHHRRCH